jgi:putative transcriptional regulator
MAINVRLDDVLYARRMSLTELSDQIGITLANLSVLKTGKARAIRFSTLEAICRALACQPGDILEFRASDENDANDANDRNPNDTGREPNAA